VLVALDKLDKIGADGVAKELAGRGVAENVRQMLLQVFAEVHVAFVSGSKGAALGLAIFKVVDEFIGADTVANSARNTARENLRSILEFTQSTSAGERMVFDPFLARGLSYYTGAIMEVNVADLAGSLGGGGRYDNLIGMFSGQDIPACGFSLGLERILVVMTERGMFPATLAMSPADVMVAMFDASTAADAMRVADQLRACGLRVIVYPDAERIGKQIKYADGRGIPFVALLGDEEIKAGTVDVKDLAAQTQQTYEQSAAGTAILEALKRRG
jgi:histidyl-tRNA synthetase